jgi:hypothetical protein
VEPTDMPIALEFSATLTGPWTTNAPQTDESRRLLRGCGWRAVVRQRAGCAANGHW